MKTVHLFLVTFGLAVQQLPAQPSDDNRGFIFNGGDISFAPLLVFTNGSGQIFPYVDGQLLQVGRRYSMLAVPDRGYVFADWEPVDVFTFTQTNYDESGQPIYPLIVSTALSPVPEYTRSPLLKFTMQQPVEMTGNGANPSVTLSEGWQANFVPVIRPFGH